MMVPATHEIIIESAYLSNPAVREVPIVSYISSCDSHGCPICGPPHPIRAGDIVLHQKQPMSLFGLLQRVHRAFPLVMLLAESSS
jgi:hypothetical protein